MIVKIKKSELGDFISAVNSAVSCDIEIKHIEFEFDIIVIEMENNEEFAREMINPNFLCPVNIVLDRS